MKVHGWRALVAGGALAIGSAAWAAGGSGDKQKGADYGGDWTEESQGTGGSGQHGQKGQQAQQQQGEQGQQQTASLSGDVVEKRQDMVFLRLEQGAVLPIKVNQQTTAQAPQGQKELRGQKTLKKVNVGDRLSVEVRSQGGENVAQSIEYDEKTRQQQEIQGRIASVQGNWINLEHEGALVPLKTDQQTQFQSEGERQIKSARELRPGDEVRASFRAEGTINNAERIQLSGEGRGGAGEEGVEVFEGGNFGDEQNP
jgi:hypothetical protein